MWKSTIALTRRWDFHINNLTNTFYIFLQCIYIIPDTYETAECGSSKRNNLHWKKLPQSLFRAARERQGGWDTTEQHTECESRTPPTDSNNKQSQDRRNVGERNLNETRKIHPKVINLSKRNLTESEIKLLKNELKFTPTPNEDKTMLGADIDVF